MDWPTAEFICIDDCSCKDHHATSRSRPVPARVSSISKSHLSTAPPCHLVDKQKSRIVWTGEGFGQPKAQWAKVWLSGSADIDSIRAILGPLHPLLDFGGIDDADIPITIEPLAEGTWNQAFTISKESGDRHFVFRVSKPVFPWFKVESEVATMHYVATKTTIPVPHVYAYDSSSDNALGYEWILMDKIAGSSFYDLQSDMSMEERLDVAKTVADWVHQLHSLQFESIGSVYFDQDLAAEDTEQEPGIVSIKEGVENSNSPPATTRPTPRGTAAQPADTEPAESTSPPRFRLGPPVLQEYMGDWRLEYPIPRGPFPDLHTLMRSLLACYEAEVRDPRQHLRARYDSLLGQVDMVDDYRAGAKFAVYSVDQEFSDIPEQERNARLDEIKSTAEAELATLEDINAVKQGNDFIDWDTNRYTITQGLAVEVDRFSEMLEQCSDCSEILDILFSPSILATHAETSVPSTILFHWDISSHNILVDNHTHRITALLDWEQIHTLPRFVISGAYPPVLQPDWGMLPDSRSHLSEWDGEEGDDKPQARLHREMCWDKQLMRGAFRERLKQLDSPWLGLIKTFSEREEREKMKEETGWDADSDTDSDDVDAGQETPPMMWSDLVAEAFRIIQGLDGVGIYEARDLLEECKKFAGLDFDASS